MKYVTFKFKAVDITDVAVRIIEDIKRLNFKYSSSLDGEFSWITVGPINDDETVNNLTEHLAKIKTVISHNVVD